MLSTTSPWEWLVTNVWWARDLIVVKIEKQLEMPSGRNKHTSKKKTFRRDTPKRRPTSSTNASKDSRPKGWASTAATRSKTTLGSQTLTGTHLKIRLYLQTSYPTSRAKTSMTTMLIMSDGTIRRPSSFSKTYCEGLPRKRCLETTILTKINLWQWKEHQLYTIEKFWTNRCKRKMRMMKITWS